MTPSSPRPFGLITCLTVERQSILDAAHTEKGSVPASALGAVYQPQRQLRRQPVSVQGRAEASRKGDRNEHLAVTVSNSR